MSNRTRLIASAFVAAAVAVPFYAAAASSGSTQITAAPACLAWFGNKDDGKCLSYSNGNGINVASPRFNYCPGGSANSNCGVQSGPLAPSQTWTTPIG
ncbi:MAG TPA: hypothetical protein VH166_01560 [Mycobacterium sp.]|jgi:hypothetical protein|nr:hypothetical protein [Mycobacterium sp.]HEX4586372.1 hypothetical protein [Mycobacterium sp.]